MHKENAQRNELQAAKAGDEAALAAIIARYMPLLRRFAWRAVRPGLDFDDAVQEGLIGLFRAIEKYREGSGASFSTYAAVCMRNAIVSAQRDAGRRKHAPLNQSVPLPENQMIPGPEEQAIANEQISIAMERMQTRLSPFEKAVLRCTIDGYSRSEIAKKLGRQPKAVENALLRARRKLK